MSSRELQMNGQCGQQIIRPRGYVRNTQYCHERGTHVVLAGLKKFPVTIGTDYSARYFIAPVCEKHAKKMAEAWNPSSVIILSGAVEEVTGLRLGPAHAVPEDEYKAWASR